MTRNVLNGKTSISMTNTAPLTGISIDGKVLDYEIREDVEPLIFAPVTEYKKCGELVLVLGNKVTARTTLYGDSAVEEKEVQQQGFFAGLWNKIKSFFGF